MATIKFCSVKYWSARKHHESGECISNQLTMVDLAELILTVSKLLPMLRDQVVLWNQPSTPASFLSAAMSADVLKYLTSHGDNDNNYMTAKQNTLSWYRCHQEQGMKTIVGWIVVIP